MKSLISYGTLLLITFMIALTALGLSIFKIMENNEPTVVTVTAPAPTVAPTIEPTATPSAKATVAPKKIVPTVTSTVK